MDISQSILTSIKRLLGLEETDTSFDIDVIMAINSALFNLTDLGIGPSSGITITDKTTSWNQILMGRTDLESIKSFVYLKVRLLFDPPQSGFLIDAIKNQIQELEWRLNVRIEGGELHV